MNQPFSRQADGRAPQSSVPAIESFTLGPFQTNCFIVRFPGLAGGDAQRAWIVDASFDPDVMIRRVAELGLTVDAIVLTHTHIDHVAGLGRVKAAFPDAPIYVHEAEETWLLDSARMTSSVIPSLSVKPPKADRVMRDGDTLTLAGEPWRVLHTPGHTPGGVCLYHEASGTLIAGDTLFAGSVGRTDLFGGDSRTLVASIRSKLYVLPDDTRVLPGHGPATTIGREKKSNPFVQG